MKPVLPPRLDAQINSFSGRTWLLPDVQKWLLDTNERFLIIKGLPGTGKSMVMAWLAGAGPLPADPAASASLESIRNSVRAAHFCLANSGNIAPREAAVSLVDQLTRTVKGFGVAIAASLVGLVKIESNQNNLTVEDGAFNTGVYIERLDVSGVSDVTSFNTLLRGPLQKLYASGFAETLLFVVDGLDEAYVPSSDSSLPHLLSRVAELDVRVRFLLSCRPDPRVLKLFPGAKTIDLIDNAPAGLDEVRQYAFDSLVSVAEPRRTEVADSLAKISKNIFLYANLALGLLLKEPARMANPDALLLPDSLEGIYGEFLNRELGLNEDRWYQVYRPILGMIGVGLGDGLDKALLDRFTASDTEPVLRACAQYLAGSLLSGPFHLFHRSFYEYLFEDRNNVNYHIDAPKMHLKIAENYCAGQECGENASGWDDYGLRFTPLHLSSAAIGSEQPARHQLAGRLLYLVTSQSYQTAFQQRLRDPHTLKDEIHAALRTLSEDNDPQVLPQLVEAALQLEAFWTMKRDADGTLDFARQGDLSAAERSLALFNIESDWRQIILLCLAWLAAPANPPASRAMLDKLKPGVLDTGLVRGLWERIHASLEGAQPPPALYNLIGEPDPKILPEILKRMRGEGGDSELLGSISGELFYQRGKTVGPKGYLAEFDAPYLVAWAYNHQGQGEDYLTEYIEIHRTYPYIEYRNNSLKFIIGHLLGPPDDVWVREKFAQCVIAALAGSTVDYTEGLSLTLEGIAAAADLKANDPDCPNLRAYLKIRRQALMKTYSKEDIHGKPDRWSHNLRRLSALAVIDDLLLGNIPNSNELFARAEGLPRGLAGFRSPACLTLAEELSLCKAEAGHVLLVVEDARSAAHNIQDATFCALSTARVNAMRKNWWEKPIVDLPGLIDRFSKDPRSAEFASLHRVGETYEYRPELSGLPLPEWLRLADTLRELSQVYELPLSEFQRLNPEYAANPDQTLPAGSEVSVPDPNFTPLLAARLAAAALAGPARGANVRLIQRLVPIATPNPVTLDTLLRRLLLAAQPSSSDVQYLASLTNTLVSPMTDTQAGDIHIFPFK